MYDNYRFFFNIWVILIVLNNNNKLKEIFLYANNKKVLILTQFNLSLIFLLHVPITVTVYIQLL